jgi:hypothetical protein
MSIAQLHEDATFRTAKKTKELAQVRSDLYRDINGLGAPRPYQRGQRRPALPQSFDGPHHRGSAGQRSRNIEVAARGIVTLDSFTAK